MFADVSVVAENTVISTIYSGGSSTYMASLNPNGSNILPNVIGYEAKDKNRTYHVKEFIEKYNAGCACSITENNE